MQYGSWAGARDHEIVCSVIVCGSVYGGVYVRESVLQYDPCPPGLCTSVYVCTVRPHKSFMQCAGARPPELCTSVYFSTVRAQTDFVRYEPTRALYSVLVLAHQSLVPSAYVLVRICTVRARKGFVLLYVVRAQRALCGASPKGFVRCEPTRALYSVLVLAPQGFCYDERLGVHMS